MNKTPSALAFALLLISMLFPGGASAKAPTIKITISGGELNRPIEIKDRDALALSDVWGGQFLDVSKAAESEPPKGLHAYEVSFFVKLSEHDVRKKYVAYYYPDKGKQGFLYLPGNGDDYWLNVGTLVRKGRDGKWNYASPEWEASIKRILRRSNAARQSL